jgi:hypothetical protein
MEYKGRRYHPQCFTCAACNKRIEEPRFREHEGRRYHNHCYTVTCAPSTLLRPFCPTPFMAVIEHAHDQIRGQELFAG